MAAALLVALAGCSRTDMQQDGGPFLAREVMVDGATHRYQVFVPKRTEANGKPPVILFLHGSGERGSDGVKPTLVGLGPYVRAHADAFPAIVVFPQAPDDQEWSDNAPLAFAALDAATGEFGGDPARTYLTGISMGGYGTWDLALMQPQRFAALVPVCGGIEPHPDRPTMAARFVQGQADPFAAAAQRLRRTPVWIFHGAKDDAVPPEQSRRMAAALKVAGASDARYTEFPDANHNSWDPAYATPELWIWLFAQRR
ncbi:prolyl oligopeptidase family serine peptidase [Luteimonas sp. SX5]|uniref:Prolyl oligopeptidase family serine peptidase n=2 Tax=Luteimonas galliterrae TaxID=2940486 RepID=A0ABT0MK55_9GAMM|nr:prolyl oligopeptidase family serine peptidase [Luteimonas galliterrae]